jgi:hypothetical protein
MSDYIPFPGEQTLSPPGAFEDTRFFYFVLKADQRELQALCDRYLNRPHGGQLRYEPVGVVLLAFTHVERLFSNEADRGSIRYKDIAFWVPVLGGRTATVCLFPPLIFVDDSATLVTGRELFGLPKQLGRFQMPLGPEEFSKFSKPQFRAEVIGTLQEAGPNDWRTLLTVEYTGDAADSTEASLRSAIAKLLIPSLQDGLSIPRLLSEAFTVPCVGLKQFRDARRPASACYQAVVETPLRIQNLGRKPQFFLNAFKLTLMNIPSHPVERLGLATGEHTVPLAVFFEATMGMEAGVVVGGASAR